MNKKPCEKKAPSEMTLEERKEAALETWRKYADVDFPERYKFGEHVNKVLRTWNANGIVICAIVSMTWGIDWTVYIGGGSRDAGLGAVMADVATHGAKMFRRDAFGLLAGTNMNKLLWRD